MNKDVKLLIIGISFVFISLAGFGLFNYMMNELPYDGELSVDAYEIKDIKDISYTKDSISFFWIRTRAHKESVPKHMAQIEFTIDDEQYTTWVEIDEYVYEELYYDDLFTPFTLNDYDEKLIGNIVYKKDNPEDAKVKRNN